MKCLLIVLCLIRFSPMVALADTADLQVNGTGAASSNAASSLLQPSASQSLQATNLSGSDGSTSSGLTAPDSSNLQASTSNDAITNYLSGELVGGPEGNGSTTSDATSKTPIWDWIAVIILLIIGATVGAIYARRIRRVTSHDLLAEMPSEAQSADTPLSTEVADAIMTAEEETPQPKTNVKGAGKNANQKKGNKPKSKGKSNKKKTRKH